MVGGSTPPEPIFAQSRRQTGGSIDGIEIENVQLLRRQIARRCIYGVDINDIAVQLVRLPKATVKQAAGCETPTESSQWGELWSGLRPAEGDLGTSR